MSDDPSPLANFSGTARLFPLPNLVFFPQVMQPLHIFEPRYRQLTADALADDRLITMVLLQPGWQASYDHSPAVHPVACIGRIIAEQRLSDGRFNILLRGLSRALIHQEIPHSKLYRRARVELLEDACRPEPKAERKLRRQLIKAVPDWVAGQGQVLKQFRKLLKSDLSLSALCDIVAFALPLDLEFKQEMLEELGVDQRCRQLLHYLQVEQPPKAAAKGERKFPPEFSRN